MALFITYYILKNNSCPVMVISSKCSSHATFGISALFAKPKVTISTIVNTIIVEQFFFVSYYLLAC